MSTRKAVKRPVEPKPEAVKSPRNKGGRPPKAPEKINSERFLLYLTPAELTRLRQMHEQESCLRTVSLNQFIKDRFFQVQPPGSKANLTIADEAFNKTLASLVRVDLHLSRLSGNYNQSTIRVNSLPVSKNLKEEITKQAGLLGEIKVLKDDIKLIVAQLKLYFS